jgi:hypothetical protein
MASPFQRQALNRKLTYAGLILVLFTAAYLWRTKEFSLFGFAIKGVDAQANDLAIREQNRGEVDLIGAIARLTTIGSRGVATCVLWINAQEAQKRNQWNELDMYVRSLTKLQPHFITPWIFQSWNMSYNVSVESDRVSDKYFYITRGIQLLADGERRNRDNPDMRWSIGFFTQHKIGQSDDTNVLRSLFQLSIIPPNERDPSRFWTVKDNRKEINWAELEDFCKNHPQLTRRLREGMRRERAPDQLRQFRCERPDELIQYLEDNFRVPSLYVDTVPSLPGAWKQREDKYKDSLTDRFPVLPPKHDARNKQQPRDESALTDEKKLYDEHDVYHVSHAWFSYAQEPVPKPGSLPGSNEPIEDRVHQRLPGHMMTVIFRTFPAQALRFSSERLQDEGWFDAAGWEIPNWFRDNGGFSGGKAPVVGAGRAWGLESWQRTLEAWKSFGTANHLLLSPQEEKIKNDRANAFAAKYGLNVASVPPPLRDEALDAETREQLFSFLFMRELRQYLQLCNFDFHYNHALIESEPDTLKCRKTIFEAYDDLRMHNDELGALQKLQEPTGLVGWRDKVLMRNRAFRRDSLVQEYTFELQLRYINLYSRLGGPSFKAKAAGLLLTPMETPFASGACPVGFALWVPPLIQKDWDNPLLGGTFDVTDEQGVPLVSDQARTQLLQRLFPTMFAGQMASEARNPPQGGASPPPH